MREGLEVLLSGWGAQHRRVRERRRSRAWAARAHAASAGRPLIADYRLENGKPASTRSTRCARVSGRSVPAIVVTGSRMTGHDKEALEQDFHLLIKPVVPNKLRAMIAFKLAK